jgi:hypothetical protein
MTNKSIKDYFEKEAKKARQEFQEKANKNRIFTEIFDKLVAFDFAAYKLKVAAEIKKNIKEWWTNPEKGIVKEYPIQVILFEYDGTWWKDKEALAYGIWKWDNYDSEEEDPELGYNYEFTSEFEAMPGISLDYFNCFGILDDDEKVREEYNAEDYWDLDGYDELTAYAEAKGNLVIHEVFADLQAENAFSELNLEDKCFVFFGEHDMGETTIFIIEK